MYYHGAFKANHEPKSLVIVECFHIHKREQAAGESIAEYIAELRRLTAKCVLAKHLYEVLRDCFGGRQPRRRYYLKATKRLAKP